MYQQVQELGLDEKLRFVELTKQASWKTFIKVLDNWKIKQVEEHLSSRSKFLNNEDILVTQGQLITIAIIKKIHNQFMQEAKEALKTGRLSPDENTTVQLP